MSNILRIGIIYKITYPNGKIYIGQDRTDDANYFGSADGFTIKEDFTQEELDDFTIRKEVLRRVPNTTIKELNKIEKATILEFQSNNPAMGYNRTLGNPRRICKTAWK